MNLPELFAHPLGQRLAVALLHFVWQGAAVATVSLLLLRFAPFRTPQTRYAYCLAALVLMALCPVATFVLGDSPLSGPIAPAASDSLADAATLRPPASALTVKSALPAELSDEQARPSTLVEPSDRKADPFVAATTAADLRIAVAAWVDQYHSLILRIERFVVPCWLAGVLLLSGRLLFGFWELSRLRRTRRPLPRSLGETINRLSVRLGFQRAPLVALSSDVTEALAAGLFRPMVLLPASWLASVPPAVLEAVIAHELAHIRRWDLWVNLFQRVVETLLFYHPAVWWLSQRLRSERELCSDALAVRAVGGRVVYAEALEFVARKRWRERQLLLAAGFGGKNMAVLNRVRHVLGTAQQKRQTGWWSAGLIALAVPAVWWIAASATVNAAAGEEEAAVAAADEERGEGDKERGGRPEGRERDGDRPGPREGERRDGDRPGPREGERRDGDRPGPREGDRPRPERPEGDRPRPERPDGPPREGRPGGPEGRREGGPREGERPPGPPWRAENEELLRAVRELREEVEQLRREVRELREGRGLPPGPPGGPRPEIRGPREDGGPRPPIRPGVRPPLRDGERPEGARRDGERPEGARRDGERPDPPRRDGED
jgi:beta-lactamase regulating signal transducer with metallopeptidase domain